jgi:hypothetical protein
VKLPERDVLSEVQIQLQFGHPPTIVVLDSSGGWASNVEEHLKAAEVALERGDYASALALLSPLLDRPQTARPLILIGQAFIRLDIHGEAAAAFERAAELEPSAANVLLGKAAVCHLRAGGKDSALALAIRVMKQDNRNVDAAFVLASVFSEAGDMSIVDLVKNTLVISDEPEHLELAARLIGDDFRNQNNLLLHAKLRRLKPDDQAIRFRLLDLARIYCDYDILDAENAALAEDIGQGREDILRWETPLSNLSWCGDERLNRIPENVFGLEPAPPGQAERRRAFFAKTHHWGETIRIGYLSSDFWPGHATMKLLSRVLQLHDRTAFDVTLFCHTPAEFVTPEAEAMRQSWGRIVPVAGLDDAAAAGLIRERGVDILVDLKGHTGGSRSVILNHMAAPVQVSWLGFPGSLSHVDCDYVIGDTSVLPESSRPQYHERFCRLPDSYQPNDPVARPLPAPQTRAQWGLPEDRFVFASFNATKKITPETLALWAGILGDVPGSILWLLCDHPLAQANILKRLAALGITSDRVVFARRADYGQHISRLALADLALDSFPYNGHTTTSEKLWAGLPVVTKRGRNFASRVSESLLSAVGLADLVADDENGFRRLAIGFATDPAGLAAIRERLAAARATAPLFDAEGFCRHLESAYRSMAATARRGEPPAHFDVMPPSSAAVR